jgi:hypothetical protein
MKIHVQPTLFPNTGDDEPPRDNNYQAAAWLLGRYPRLERLAHRIEDVMRTEDGEPWIDLYHLAHVVGAVEAYDGACMEYECKHREPRGAGDMAAGERWKDAGPNPDDIIQSLGGFLPMSSGEGSEHPDARYPRVRSGTVQSGLPPQPR